MKTIYDYSYSGLEELVLSLGWKKYRADQIFQWLYRKHATSFDQMTDLSKEMIAALKEQFCINPIQLVEKQVSRDGTIKFLFELGDGALVECVLMTYNYGRSLCVTSQIGCNMGCTFCASGLLKKQRDLTSGEMVAQVMTVQLELDKEEDRISHVVVMGTGEPFDNYDNVLNFCNTINHDKGLAIGARHITISTSVLIPSIDRFAAEHKQYNLAISLHAPTDELRSRIMPVNKAYPLGPLMACLRRYSVENNRRLTFEYILLQGVNDTNEMAVKLAALIRGMNAYVNLIPYNQVDENGYKSTDYKSAMRFYDVLMKQGVKATLRQEHGNDIDAACGQLRAKHERMRGQ